MDEAPHYRPLYRQVYDSLVRQIVAGAWRPGESLPSEQALAAKLGVSQGTVRKALDTLTVENLVERRQGKGTYVAEHTQERSLFRFFRLNNLDGSRAVPTSGGETVKQRAARRDEIAKLKLEADEKVFEVTRTRFVEGVPMILEKIVLPAKLFPGFERRSPLPNALYSMYQHDYALNIVAANEELRSDLARKDEARRLKIAPGAPLLHIERVAIALDGTRVEWRTSRCNTRHVTYAVTLS